MFYIKFSLNANYTLLICFGFLNLFSTKKRGGALIYLCNLVRGVLKILKICYKGGEGIKRPKNALHNL